MVYQFCENKIQFGNISLGKSPASNYKSITSHAHVFPKNINIYLAYLSEKLIYCVGEFHIAKQIKVVELHNASYYSYRIQYRKTFINI